MFRVIPLILKFIFLVGLISIPAFAQVKSKDQINNSRRPIKRLRQLPREPASEELAKKSQNPLARLKKISFDNNFIFGAGPEDDAFIYTLRAGLIFPVSLGKIDVINRWFVPLIYQDEIVPTEGSAFGISDMFIQTIFSPSEPRWGLIFGEMTWGIGPVISIPTSTEEMLGTDKISIGPVFAIARKPGDWVFGWLAQNLWSVAGDEDAPKVNEFTLQYFINYNLKNGFYLTASNFIIANWEADSDNRWTVPIGGGFGRVIKIGEKALDFKVQSFWIAERPKFGPDWSLQFGVKLLFP